MLLDVSETDSVLRDKNVASKWHGGELKDIISHFDRTHEKKAINDNKIVTPNIASQNFQNLPSFLSSPAPTQNQTEVSNLLIGAGTHPSLKKERSIEMPEKSWPLHLKHGNDTAPTNWTNENVEALKDNSSEASYAKANAISTTQQSIQTGVNHSIPYVDNSAHLMDHNIFTDEMVDDLAYSLFGMTKPSSSHQSSNLIYINYLEAPAMSNNTPQVSESNIFQPEHLSNLNVSDLDLSGLLQSEISFQDAHLNNNTDETKSIDHSSHDLVNLVVVDSNKSIKLENGSTDKVVKETTGDVKPVQGQDKTFGSETAVVGFNNLIPYPIEPISFESFFQNDSIDSGFSSMFDTNIGFNNPYNANHGNLNKQFDMMQQPKKYKKTILLI